jgi:ribosomal protein L20
MPELADDDFWREYEIASAAHRRAMETRMNAERELAREYSEESITRWNAAHREEDQCYEQLKAAERVVWAKYKKS